MNYTLQRAAPGRVELRRSRTGQFVLGAVLGVLGVPSALLGGFIALADPVVGGIMAGFGLAFSGGMLLVLTRHVGPGAFVFDDAAQGLLAYRNPNASGEAEGRLPYSHIAELRVGEYESSSSEGRSVSYALDVVKRDGVCWSLVTFGSRDKADQLLSQVLSHTSPVQPTQASEGGAPTASSGHFHVEQKSGETRIRFKKPYRLVTHAGGLLVLAGICLAILHARYQMPQIAFYISLGILCFALAAVLFGVVNGIGKYAVLLITPQTLRAQEEGGVVKAWFEEPIAGLHAVCFAYRPNQDDRALMLLKQGEYQSLVNIQQGDRSNPIGTALALLSVRKLEVGELTLAQKLELEQLIQDEVERVSGKRLL